MRRFILLMACFFLTSCASFGRGMVQGLLENKSHQPPECLIWSSGFSGLAPLDTHTVKILLVHGIGNHTPGHSTAFMLALTQPLGMTQQDRSYKEIQLRDAQNQPVGILRVYRFTNPETGKQMIFYEQPWSAITFPSKQLLSYDTNQEYSARRALLNKEAKKYLNATLPDPLIYLGPDGQKMLDSSVQSFCWMTTYTYEALPPRADDSCRIGAHAAMNSLRTDNFAFITSSLGSRIVIDALQVVANQIGASNGESQKALSLLRQKEIMIFMLANQLPLLQMGRTRPENQGQISAFCTPKGALYNERMFQKLSVIAFSDPNDLLSYALEPGAADTYFDSKLCPEISNVSLTTTPTMDFGFGDFANPLSAHKNYIKNETVIKLIVNGLKKGYDSAELPAPCRWIELKGK